MGLPVKIKPLAAPFSLQGREGDSEEHFLCLKLGSDCCAGISAEGSQAAREFQQCEQRGTAGIAE